jgi:hypothetical protein
MPLAAASQAAPDAGSAPAERAEPSYKYEVYAGYGYTSLNQVNQSRNGLQGVSLAVTRDFGKYFGLTAEGGYYKFAYDTTNPGNPSVSMALLGPEFHGPLFGKLSVFVHALVGGQHTGGESVTPKLDFAMGAGIGMEYKLMPRISLRAYGDDIAASSVQDPNHLGYSTHMHRNSRASIGVVYRF